MSDPATVLRCRVVIPGFGNTPDLAIPVLGVAELGGGEAAERRVGLIAHSDDALVPSDRQTAASLLGFDIGSNSGFLEGALDDEHCQHVEPAMILAKLSRVKAVPPQSRMY